MEKPVKSGCSAAADQYFQYRQLAVEEHEIRLLRIPPTSASGDLDGVNFALFHVSLDVVTSFQALSYTWGAQDPPSNIRVNGRTLHITPNLAAALKNLQRKDEECTCWVDSICINQNDPGEKTAQVQLMRRIYQTAEEVIIWLGPSTPQTDCTIQETRKLGAQLLEMGIWNHSGGIDVEQWERTEDDGSCTARFKIQIIELAQTHLTQARNGKYPFWWVMSDLGQRIWFRRIWCIQECANAKVATFRCGNEDVDFQTSGHKALLHPPQKPEEYWKIIWLTDQLQKAFPTDLVGIRRKFLTSPGHDLRTLLYTSNVIDSSTERIQATDDRDRVYALLGIANDAAATHIKADYTLSCEDAYTAAARVLLQHNHDDILSLCRTRDVCKDIPSWVPDWSALNRKPWSVWYYERLFNASGAGQTTMEVIDDSNVCHLVLKGTLVDTIREVGHVWSLDVKDKFDHTAALNVLNNVKDYLSRSEKYDLLQKEEASWRIPVGDTAISTVTSQMERAPAVSYMKTGEHVLRLVAEGKAMPEDVQADRQPHASYMCQMERMHDSRPFLSKSGYVGMCPMESQVGDSLVIFMGARVPYVIRRSTKRDCWTLIGESHTYGIMDGEFMEQNPAVENITWI